jgi:hypothetical protein
VERCVGEDEGEETLGALGNDEALRLEPCASVTPN